MDGQWHLCDRRQLGRRPGRERHRSRCSGLGRHTQRLMRVTRRAALSASAGALASFQRCRTLAQDVPRAPSLGPSVPPELHDLARNWPLAQGNFASTRAAVACDISSANVGQLEQRWTFAIEASTGYGGMTATPLVLGDGVYAQDMRSNVFALDRAT